MQRARLESKPGAGLSINHQAKWRVTGIVSEDPEPRFVHSPFLDRPTHKRGSVAFVRPCGLQRPSRENALSPGKKKRAVALA